MGQGLSIPPVDLSILDPSSEDDSPQKKMMRLMLGQNLIGQQIPMQTPDPPPTSAPAPSSSGGGDLEDYVRGGGAQPPGFDSGGMPTEFPATAPMQAAKARLQKLQQPQSTKKLLLKAALDFAPTAIAGLVGGLPAASGAAQGAFGAEQMQHERHMQDVSRATQEYQFEAGKEEQQREMAVKEKLAIEQIESQKAYRSLMAAIANRKVDVTQQANEQKDTTRLAGMGYVKDEQGRIRPMDVGDLSELQRRKISVDQANAELKKAQTAAIPQQIEIKKKQLDMAIAHLSAYLQNMQFNQDLHREQQDFRETGPTTQMRDRAQQAGVIGETSKGLIDNIRAGSSHLGPIMGRYGSLTDFLGAPPPEYANLASQLTTYIALQPAAHGFRGLRAVAEFEKSIGTPIRTPEALIAAIQGNVTGLQPMAGADKWTPLKRAQPAGAGAAPTAGSTRRLKKSAKNSQGVTPPAGAKIRDYTQLAQ